MTPEDVGEAAAQALLLEITRGGCLDRGAEWFMATLMALGGDDIRRCRIAGPLEPVLCVLPPGRLSSTRMLTSVNPPVFSTCGT